MAGDTHAADAAGHAGQTAESGFPPFDASLFSHQIFWFWIAFGALYIILASVVIPRIAKTLADRRGAVEADLQAAARETAAAQEARASAEKAAAAARAQARNTVEEMRRVNDAAASQAEAQASASANARIAEAEASIAEAKGKAMAAINDTVSELAADIVERVSGLKPTAAALKKAVQAVAGRA
jgi:F-type H+-transporting ATPase subunit b